MWGFCFFFRGVCVCVCVLCVCVIVCHFTQHMQSTDEKIVSLLCARTFLHFQFMKLSVVERDIAFRIWLKHYPLVRVLFFFSHDVFFCSCLFVFFLSSQTLWFFSWCGYRAPLSWWSRRGACKTTDY